MYSQLCQRSHDGGLELTAGDRLLRFPAIWLRDNCPCAECVDPGSKQKLRDITEIPNGLVVSAAEDAGELVVVTYAPDQHRSAFSRSWLVRRWDDEAKNPEVTPPGFAHFVPLLQALVRS